MCFKYYSSVFVEKNLDQFTTVISSALKGKYWSLIYYKDISHNKLNEQQKEIQASKQTKTYYMTLEKSLCKTILA